MKNIFLILIVFLFEATTAQNINSLKTELQIYNEGTRTKPHHDTTHINLLNALAWEYKYTNPDTSYHILQSALALAEKINWKKGQANALRNIGGYNLDIGNYPQALAYYFKALEINRALNDKKGIAATLGNIGIVYDDQGDYPKALEHYFESLKIKKEMGNKIGMAASLGNIGIVYFKQSDYPKALEHFLEAMKIDKEKGNKSGIAIRLGNIGNVYNYEGDYPKALEYYLEALKIDKELGNKSGIARHLGNIGNVYENQGDYTKALKNFFESLKIDKELGNKSGIAKHFGNMSSFYTKTGHFKEAEAYLDSALTLCENIGILNILMQVEESATILHDTLARIALSQKQYKESVGRFGLALKHHRQYSTSKDTLFNEEKSKEIGRKESQHEWEMAELMRIQHEADMARKHAEIIKRRNMLQYSGIVIVLAILIISLFYSRRIMNKLPERIYFLPFKGIMGVNKSVIALGLLFSVVFLVFETMSIFFDADIDGFTSGSAFNWLGEGKTVIAKTLISCVFAGTVSIVYYLLENLMKKKLGLTAPAGNAPLPLILLLVLGAWNLGLGPFKVDSLKRALSEAEMDDTTRVNTLNALSNHYFSSAPDSALLFSQQALSLSNKIEFKKGCATSYDGISRYYWMTGDYPKALKYLFEKKKIFEKLNDKQGIAATLGNIGIVYKEQGDYPKAMEHYFESLKIDKELMNKRGIAKHLCNIGIVYWNQSDYSKTLEYYFESLKMYKELKDKSGIATNLGNIGIVYNEQGDYPKALEHFLEAMKIGKELGDKGEIATNLGNIGIVYDEQGKAHPHPDSSATLRTIALEYYFEALKICKEIGDKRSETINLGNIGSLYTTTGRFKEAEAYLDSSLAIDTSIGYLLHENNTHQGFVTLHDTIAQIANGRGQWQEAAKRYQQALVHHRKYDITKDSLFNEEKAKEIGRLEQGHQIEIAEFERKKEEERIDAEQAKAKERQNQIGFSLVFVAFIAIMAFVILFSRITLPNSVIQICTTIPFLLLFETAIVFLDPYTESIVQNAPALKLCINFILALCFYPIHNKAEHLLKLLFKRQERRKRGKKFRGS